MSDTSGPTSSEPFASYDPDLSCWRTSQGTFPWGSDEFSGTWPTRGSMRNGVCSEPPMSAHPTGAPACSLLPTPTANQPGGTAEQMLDRKARMADGPRSTVTDLRMVVELLPTPTARLGAAGPDYRERPNGDDLQAAIRRGASTPQRSSGGSESWDVPLPNL